MLLSTDQTNLYEVIGLPQNASQHLIEDQCIRLGEQYRPDKNSGDLLRARAFAQVEKAYETLRDPEKRAAYDAELLWQSSKSTKEKSVGRVVTVIASMLTILLSLGYVLAYRPYITQREEAIRTAAEETRKTSESNARILEAQLRASEERARVAEAQAKATEERARVTQAQARAAEDRASQAEAMNRADQIKTPKQTASERFADAEDLERVEKLRAQCASASAASQNARGGSGTSGAAGSFYASSLAIAYCNRSERAVKDRQRYEALRSEDPHAAAKLLEAQQAARERNRPVITNCNSSAPGYATCISR